MITIFMPFLLKITSVLSLGERGRTCCLFKRMEYSKVIEDARLRQASEAPEHRETMSLG